MDGCEFTLRTEQRYSSAVEVEKIDREISLWAQFLNWTGINRVQGDADLIGIEFEIENMSPSHVLVDGVLHQPNQVVKTITTEMEVRGGVVRYFANTSHLALPFGTYRIREVRTNDSYLLTDGEWRYFEIREHGVIVHASIDGTDMIFSNYVVAGDVAIEKWDIELNASESLGGGSLAKINFAIYNRSTHPILFAEGGRPFTADNVPRIVMPGERVTVITTAWDKDTFAYVARTLNRSLAFGTFEIVEIGQAVGRYDETANLSYMTEEEMGRVGIRYTFTIREDGEVVTVDTQGRDMVFRNQVRRGDVVGVKIADASVTDFAGRIGHVPFAVTNVMTEETRVIVSDLNGEFNTHHSWNGRHRVNANDFLLELEANGEPLLSADMDIYSGTWFGLGQLGTMADVHPTFGAMPFGWYHFREMRAETNAGMAMLEFYVHVSRDGHTISLGTMTNFGDMERPIFPDPDGPIEDNDDIIEDLPILEDEPMSYRIRTRAHTGDGRNQHFVHGDTLYLFDIVEIEIFNGLGYKFNFSAMLNNHGVDYAIYVSENIYFTVDEQDEFGIWSYVFEIVTSIPIDTSAFDPADIFFWSETLRMETTILDTDTGEYVNIWDNELGDYVTEWQYGEVPVWVDVYHHNPAGTDPRQNLYPRLDDAPYWVNIATQAHTGDCVTQTFTWGDEVLMHDDIRITHFNVEHGTRRAFRAYLFAVLPDGADLPDAFAPGVYADVENAVLIWTTPYIEYEVVADIMNFRVYVPVDTSQFPQGTRFFFTETAYRKVTFEDADTGETLTVWEEDYRHNFDGTDENQTLWPEGYEPEALVPEGGLPDTGFTRRRFLTIGMAAVSLGLVIVVVIRKKQLATEKTDNE